RVMPGHDARWERNYSLATEYGDVKGPASITEQTSAQLKALVRPMEQTMLAQERIGAMLDVNAIMVNTGQTLWFYRWVETEPQRVDNSVWAMAVEGDNRLLNPFQPRSRMAAPSAAVVRSGEIEAVSHSGRSADEERALY